MALVPYDPFRAVDLMRREMDRFLSPVFTGFREEFNGGPRVDVYETENDVVALCEIPGVEKKDDININIHDNVLAVSGIINRTNEVKDENKVHRTERFYGRFQRSITLPAKVSPEGVKASYRNGVLEIKMPKEPPGQHKAIDVEWH